MKMTKYLIIVALCISISQTYGVPNSNKLPDSKPNIKQKLFDGKTFKGWEGDTQTLANSEERQITCYCL